jgi:predicted aspartyl protease
MTPAAARALPWVPLLAVPLLIGAAQPPFAQPPSAEPIPPPVTATGDVVPFIQPFDLDATRRMAVPVMIGNQGPFSFLVDTGAERTVIARELAERLDLVEGAKLRLATIGNLAVVPSYRVAALRMSDLHLASFDAPAFAGRHIGAAGLIGIDMLENRRVVIDFRKGSMQILETRRHARPIIRDDDAIVVRARNMAGRLILSGARIEGTRVDVIVDTDAQTSIGNLALQRLVVDRKAHRRPFAPAILGAVSGENVPAMRTVIKQINVEDVGIRDLPVSFTDSRAFAALDLNRRPALLLGMDGLALFDRIEIDFPNKRVVFDMPDGASRDARQRFAAIAGTRRL